MIKSFNVVVTRSDDSIAYNEVTFKIASAVDVVKIYRAINFHFPNMSDGELITWILALITKGGIVFLAEVSGRVVGAMGFEDIILMPASEENDCISSSWLYIHNAYKDQYISAVLVNMAREYVAETDKIIKLNPKCGVSEIQNDVFFRLQGFESQGDSYIYQKSMH